MKNQFVLLRLKKILFSLVLLSIIIMFNNCDESTGPEKQNKNSQARTDIETITEFFAVKQSVTYDILKIFSHEYTTKFFEGETLTYQEIDKIFKKLSSLAEYEKTVTAAADNIISKTSLNKAGNISSNQGLGNALKGFFTWLTGSAKRSRDRILKVASNLSESDRTKLYNSLRSGWKNKTSSESDFWKKLEEGKFDNQASQMYNDFYHNAETDFPFVAQDKNLTIQKIVYKEGAEGVEKGGKLMIEVVKTTTPLGKGMDMVEKADEYKEKVKKLYNDPTGAIKDEIKSALADKIGSYMDIDGFVDGNLISKNTGEAIKFISDYTLGSDNPSDLIKNTIDLGLGKLLDSDSTGKKADIALAEKKNDDGKGPSVVISVDPNDDDTNLDDVIDVLVSEGDWIMSVFDEEGNNDKVEVKIDNGVGTVIVISTDPKGEHNKGEYALSVWASPADPGPGIGVTVYARVNPQVAGIEIYFNITGTDGYTKEETKVTNADGLTSFYIPGGNEGVRDIVTIKIVSTGLTRTINYTF